MNCPYCGFYCEDDVRFCPSCGKQIVSLENTEAPTISAVNIPPQSEMSPAEMLVRKAEDKTAKRYRGLIVFSLFLALALVVGAVYLMTLSPRNAEADGIESESDYVSPVVGSWMNEKGYIIITASGKFASDGQSGTYTADNSAIVFNADGTVISAEYNIDGDMLTLVTTYLGKSSEYIYYKVSERTDLTNSQLAQLWNNSES